jgi:hypothetical protein
LVIKQVRGASVVSNVHRRIPMHGNARQSQNNSPSAPEHPHVNDKCELSQDNSSVCNWPISNKNDIV